MNSKVNDIIQWIGAFFIIIGHICNSIGPTIYPLNIIMFTLGTVCFMFWSYRMHNRPQFIVNVVAIFTCSLGLYKAFYG